MVSDLDDGLNARRQARHLAGNGVLVQHPFGHTARQFWLGGFQCQSSSIGIARSDGLFDLAQEGADTRAARLVDGIAGLGLTGALLD
jgi:hypothetical protein